MKNIKISSTGLCIFLLLIPIISLIIICVSLSFISGLSFVRASTAGMTVCTVGMILSVIIIGVYMFRIGPALVALTLLKRIKKNLDEKSISELDETGLFDFVALMRQKQPLPGNDGDDGSDGDDTDSGGSDNDSESDGDTK